MKLAVLLPHTKLYGGVKRFLELGNVFVGLGHEFIVFTPDGLAPTWFDYKGKMDVLDNVGNYELDAIFTTTVSYVPMMHECNAKHKVFYHVRIREKLKNVIKFDDVEIFACSTNVYNHDLAKYGKQTFKAIGGVALANYPARSDYSCNNREFVIMGYGRLVERVKGTKYVVRACELLHAMGLNIKLLLFDTPVNDKAKKKIENFSCSCPFEFVVGHPFNRNHELFARADCFVSAENPRYSGWNNTVAEAMACGLPIVASTAGTADLINDGVNGEISARWTICFARHIYHLYKDEELRRKYGTNARKAIEQFDWQKVGENIIAYLGA